MTPTRHSPTGSRPTGSRPTRSSRTGISSSSRALVSLSAALLLVTACTSNGDTSPDEPADDTATDGPAEDDGEDEGRAGPPPLRFDGPDDGALINAEQVEQLSFSVHADEAEDAGAVLDELVLLLDGDDVTADAEVRDTSLAYEPAELEDGERTLAVLHDAGADEADADADADADAGSEAGADGANSTSGSADGTELHAWRFEVKTEPPAFELTSPEGAVRPGDDVTVAGTTDPGATVTIGEASATADDGGAFELELEGVGDERTIVVTDVAGNTLEVDDALVFVASRVEVAEIRTVHATFWAWATPDLRDPIQQMIDDGRINSLQLDLKDESGHVGYDSQVPLAQEIGATVGPLDLEQTVADLHEQDIAVIGRIVAFADPMLASWAWENGERDWVIQLPDGSDYYRGSYAGFSNYVHADVIDYNLAIAEEAAAAGVDHILWDYIRRPEGIDNYTVPGLETTPEEAIARFAQLADERLAPYGVQHGASVYGIAADRPTQIGQDIPAMAEHLDYVAPMIYPSHWGPGEYDVSDPNRQPYDIVRATLEVWEEATEGKRARIVPWLEDTSYRAWDRPHQVREQIRAARDHGIDEWLMWNPGSRFTPEAYERRE